jgi:hypothetical protein
MRDKEIEFMHRAIEAQLKKEIEVHIETAVKEVEAKLRGSIDRIALSLASEYSVSRMGSELLIRVKKEI